MNIDRDVVSLTSKISLEVFSDLLESSQLLITLDLGGTIAHKVWHSRRGNLVLINTAEGENAVIQC